MIERCGKADEKTIFDYIGKDYGKCAYLYIDLKKYGFDNEHVSVWKSIDNDQRTMDGIVLQYYNGMHVFSRENRFDPEPVAALISERKPALVCGMKEILDRLAPLVAEEYESEEGKVLRLGDYTGIYNPEVKNVKREELEAVVKLLMTDEEMGGPYTFELLYNQFVERFDTGFGRNWARWDDKGVVSHCATYAELDDIAVISGGIVREDYRGKGQYPGQLGAMCKVLHEEGKEVISYYYGGAKSAHKAVGFEILGDWKKLIRK